MPTKSTTYACDACGSLHDSLKAAKRCEELCWKTQRCADAIEAFTDSLKGEDNSEELDEEGVLKAEKMAREAAERLRELYCTMEAEDLVSVTP